MLNRWPHIWENLIFTTGVWWKYAITKFGLSTGNLCPSNGFEGVHWLIGIGWLVLDRRLLGFFDLTGSKWLRIKFEFFRTRMIVFALYGVSCVLIWLPFEVFIVFVVKEDLNEFHYIIIVVQSSWFRNIWLILILALEAVEVEPREIKARAWQKYEDLRITDFEILPSS